MNSNKKQGGIGLYWIILDFNWIELNWIELNWSHVYFSRTEGIEIIQPFALEMVTIQSE